MAFDELLIGLERSVPQVIGGRTIIDYDYSGRTKFIINFWQDMYGRDVKVDIKKAKRNFLIE